MRSGHKAGQSAALTVAALLAFIPPARAAERPIDLFSLGLDFREFCDLEDGAPISNKCMGFLAAVIEIEKGYVSLDPALASRLNRACIPPGVSIHQIFAVIRPQLRRMIESGTCIGLCDSTGYVMSSLAGNFPCRDDDTADAKTAAPKVPVSDKASAQEKPNPPAPPAK